MFANGIKIKIHPTFIVLMILCALSGFAVRAFIIFGLVILHEFAHILVARGYGLKVVSIELYPYGGTAVLEDTFEGKRMEESVIALAGPALNFTIFLVVQYLRWEGIIQGDWALEFAKINFWLAAFNLIPVLPLDGGRILRAMLAHTFGFVQITKFLAGAGKWLGGIFVILGFFFQALGYFMYEPGLFIVLGVFFWLGSGKELKNAKIVFLKHLCKKKELLLSQGLMQSVSFTVSKSTTLDKIIDKFSTDRYSLVHLFGGKDRIEDVLTETEVVQGMLQYGVSQQVGDLVRVLRR